MSFFSNNQTRGNDVLRNKLSRMQFYVTVLFYTVILSCVINIKYMIDLIIFVYYFKNSLPS